MLRTLIVFVLSNIVTLFMFTQGLVRQRGALRQVLDRPALYLRALLVVLVLVPLVALAVVMLFRLPTVVGSAVLLMAVCPGAPLQLNQAKSFGASPTTSMNLLMLLCVFSLVTVPFWVARLDVRMGVDFEATPALVFRLLAVKIFPPLVVGIAVQRLFPRAAAALAPWCNRLFTVLLLAVAVVLLFIVGPQLLKVAWLAVLALVVMVTLAALLGHWAGGPRLEDRKAVAIAAAFAHPVLSMTIISQSYPNLRALQVAGVVGAYVLIRVAALLPYRMWVKRREDSTRSRWPHGGVPA
ncbi:hypothetical protein LZ198_11295 [Myxococcus sp. K15C18031901]|uniref:hypothetical protein n=1 Tax=Myxococcus dinghuensis TaxID=2906761 RepID=UPI0020A70E29|nr:hypothetical protein [Myxococcus dinghuensis]MCP3099455.1 hypothetical protein [Myxococcus dinghuensis]